MKSAIGGLVAVSMLCGCASAVRGTTEKVVINATPDASVRTSLGHSCPTSPCTVEVSRKTEFTAYAEKEGYQPGSLFIGTKFSGGGAAGLAGNILIGGIIGMGVDAATGATLDHFPNPAVIALEPVGSAKSSTTVIPPATSKPGKPTSPPVS